MPPILPVRRFPTRICSEAPRIAREVAIDPSVPGWTSTGLYAAPGEAIEATAPTALL